ncbi:DNA polymerase III subunit epsilon [Mucilaginibacter sp. Bleaf8]|uniref:3'-5' exonuclease n=1 Tax=Mucilaginibacter sp. Bleaf8 TaxID=2834430 RepID=UPI001BCD2DB3|nr:3'-5' exonuclease [Mucilaginibacter sp. Bleaf8]MBS7565271.1 DNA polymerase III subunit epsilon [Mucilaginibacter sp. Bleaf8]
MKLNLKRPLAFFDLETTGTSIGTDRVIEIAFIKLLPDGTEESKTWLINPQMPIPLETSLIHGFYDDDVKDAPVFKDVADEIAAFIIDADLAGYNSNKFDIPMLMEEFLRAGVAFDMDGRHFVDVQNIFHQMEQRTLKAAYRFYCDKDIINAHTAEADTRATMEVLLAQVERYANTEWEDKKGNKSIPVVNDVAALHEFTNLHRAVDFVGRMVYNDEGHEVFNFGKHKGKRVEDVYDAEPSYFAWIMNGDFPLYTKRKAEEIYRRWQQNRPAKPAKPADGATQNDQQKPKPEFNKPKKDFQKQNFRPHNQQPQHNKPFKKKEEPAAPVNEDMLQMLANKFKKG